MNGWVDKVSAALLAGLGVSLIALIWLAIIALWRSML